MRGANIGHGGDGGGRGGGRVALAQSNRSLLLSTTMCPATSVGVPSPISARHRRPRRQQNAPQHRRVMYHQQSEQSPAVLRSDRSESDVRKVSQFCCDSSLSRRYVIKHTIISTWGARQPSPRRIEDASESWSRLTRSIPRLPARTCERKLRHRTDRNSRRK